MYFLFRMARWVHLIFLLMIQGVYSVNVGWDVTYSSSHICALKRSTVIIYCSYSYPTAYKIEKVFWTNTDTPTNAVFPDLSKDPEYSKRIEYLGDKDHDCTVRLTDVRHTDSHDYYFRFITDMTDGKWLGYPGVTLTITDLQLESSGERVIERHSVTLTCKITCSLSDGAEFIWYKNTQLLNETTDNQLILSSVSRDDAGDYSCAVKRHRDLRSSARRLTVIYAPDNPVIFIKPSDKIVEGDSVNLTCSTDANPPAEISWFKENKTSPVGSGKIYIISNISSDHSGEYKCKARNEHGVKYSAVTLNVLYGPKNVTASISGSSGVIMEDDSVNLTCSTDANPPAHNYSWFMENKTSSVGSGPSFRALESGWFYCVAQNEVGSQRSDAVTVTVNQRSNWHLLIGITAACGGFFIIAIIIIVFIMRKKRVKKTDDTAVNQGNLKDDLYCNIKHDAHVSESSHHNDVQYDSISPKRLRGGQTSAEAAPEEIQYATVYHHSKTETRTSEEDENHYGNIRNDQPDVAVRSNVEDTSVIYSRVK